MNFSPIYRRFFLPADDRYSPNLQKHVDLVCQGAALLAELTAGRAGADEVTQLAGLEKEADGLVRQVSTDVRRTLFAPFDREEILRLILRLDDVLDTMEDASTALLCYGVLEHKPGGLEIRKHLTRLPEMGQEIENAVGLLQQGVGLLKGFTGDKLVADQIHRIKEQIGVHEHAVDFLERDGIFTAYAGFRQGQPLDPVCSVIQQVYSLVEAVMDAVQDAADAVDAIAIARA